MLPYTYIIVLLIIFVKLKNLPDIVLIRLIIVTETADFLLTRSRALNFMRVQVGTSRNVLETNFILETDFVSGLFLSYARRKDNPSAFIAQKLLGGEDLLLLRTRFIVFITLGSEETTSCNMLK